MNINAVLLAVDSSGSRVVAALVGVLSLALGAAYVWAGLDGALHPELPRRQLAAHWGLWMFAICRGLGGLALGIGFIASAACETARPLIVGGLLFGGLITLGFGLRVIGWLQLRQRPG
ncbi:MAG: hypothetical protein ACT4OV_14650 [Microthrixaceae bacterium]